MAKKKKFIDTKIDEKSSIEDQIYSLINNIKDIELTLLEEADNNNIQKINFENKLLKIKDDIANAVDANGKSLYSNDIKRNAAFIELKINDTDLIETENEIRSLDFFIAKKKIELQYLKNLLSFKKQIFEKQ